MSVGNWIDWVSFSRKRRSSLDDCFVLGVLRRDRFKDGLLSRSGFQVLPQLE
jgi:hypothetical protein